ncbi:PAS domain-containing protein [Pantanalinema sp. GBBB05]|uniref:PAS domain-containing protein n=1 Tax=Pantanalinema sp. GBBB05 TaxID=2604139 RepID=UPI001E12AF33|nr:PAS domain-containing protein [Pantanalinema sp. GBBB05]
MFNKRLIKKKKSFRSRQSSAVDTPAQTRVAGSQPCDPVAQELNRRNRELETFHRISTIHLHPRSLQTAFQTTVEEISLATGFPIVTIERYDAIRQVMVFEGSKGIPLPPDSPIFEVPVDQTYSGSVVRLKQPVIRTCIPGEFDACEANVILNQLAIQTLICIPLLVNEHAIGTLGLAHPEAVTIDEALLQWLTSLASYITLLMEHQQADMALKRSQQQYQALVQSIDGIVWEYDLLTQQFSFVSQKAEAILGYPIMQWLAEPEFWENHIHPADREWVIKACKTAAALKQDSLFEYRMLAADQRIVWIQDVVSVVVEHDQAVQLRGVLIDISERKRIEAEHQQVTQLLRLQGKTLEACANGIVITDRHGIIQWVNPAFTTLTGYTAAEARGKNPSVLVKSGHHQQKFYDHLWNTILSGQVWRGELINRRKDGSLYDEEMTITPIRDQQGEISHFIAIKQDVSDRKHIELELLATQSRLNMLLSASPAVIYALHPDALDHPRYISDNLRTVTGYDPESVIRQPGWFFDCVHPGDREVLFQQAQAWLNAGAEGFTSAHYRFQNADGSWIWVYDQLTAVRDQSGEVIQLVGAFANVTAQVESDRRLEQISRHVPGVIYQYRLRTDGTSHFPYASEGIREIYGIAPSEVANDATPVFAVLHPDDVERVSQSIMASAELLTVWQCEYRVQLQDGQIHWLYGQATPQKEPDGSVLWHGYITNVTDRKAVETHLAALYQQVQQLNATLEVQVQERTTQLQQALDFEAMLKRITDKVRDSLDEQQILQTVVTELAMGLEVSCCDTNLYDLEQKTSTVCAEYTTSLPPLMGKVIQMASASNPVIYEQLLQGQYCQFCQIVPSLVRPLQHEFAILTCPIWDDQGVLGDLWLFRSKERTFDSLEIRLVQQVANQCAIALRQARLYQAVQRQVETLEHLNQLKDDFLSTVSHELRTPMASIKMATQLLEISFQRLVLPSVDSTPIQRYLQILQDECDRETHLINDLLDLCRLDARTEPLQLTTMNLSMWIMHITEAFIVRTHNQQQSLVFNLPSNLPSLTTDFSYLQRILIELLNNACKYTPRGETISLAVECHLGMDLDSDSCFEIRITNTGVTISPTEQERIFDKFYRIPNHDPWKHGGTGLGLALVKRLVEQLQGSIQVEGNDNAVTFWLQLPNLQIGSVNVNAVAPRGL